MSSKERFFQVVEHPERRDFYNFLQFFKFYFPPEDEVTAKK